MYGPVGPQAEKWVQRRTGLYHHLIEDTPHAIVGLAQVTGIYDSPYDSMLTHCIGSAARYRIIWTDIYIHSSNRVCLVTKY
jgi:hypothetical protein